jgi:tetratricopeptide (TPR) repeat protein
MRVVDWAALALLLFEVPSVWFSRDRANSIGGFEVVALSVLAYFVLRLLTREPPRIAWLATIVGFGGAWLTLIGVHQFATAAQQLSAVGLTNLVAFRSRLMDPIPGWVSGECLTAIMLTLPFACGAGAYAWRKGQTGATIVAGLFSSAMVAALVLSLSRAAFWGTVCFFIVACGLMATYRVLAPRAALFLLGGCLAAFFLIMACEASVYPSVVRAYFESQASQTRSTEGRINIWEHSLGATRGHHLWGVGSSNTALFLLSSNGEETTGFASRAFSLPIQVIVEKGCLGFTCYLAFLLLLAFEFHRVMKSNPSQIADASSPSTSSKRKKEIRLSALSRSQTECAHRAMKCCFAAGLASVLFRELSYSSLLEHTLTMALALTLAALICLPVHPENLKIKPITLSVVLAVLICQFPYWHYRRADSSLSEFYALVGSAKFDVAKLSIEEAIRLWPWNGRYYGWRAYVESQELPSQCTKRPHNGTAKLDNIDYKAAQEAAKDYRLALKLNSRDGVAYHNLAWQEHLLGDDDSAARDWDNAVAIDPDNAAFHLSYGMFLEERGAREAARLEYVSAIMLKPSIVDSPFFTQYRTRSSKEAAAALNEVAVRLERELGDGNDPILEARLGKIYLVMGDAAHAEKLLAGAAQQLPNLPLVWFNLGELYEQRGDNGRALEYYQRARTIDPSLAGSYLRIGKLRLREGDKQNGANDLRLAIQQWQRITPVSSAHNNRLYDGPRQTIDDLLPTTLVWYTSPCEASAAWGALAEIYPQNADYAQRSNTCENLPAPHGALQ